MLHVTCSMWDSEFKFPKKRANKIIPVIFTEQINNEKVGNNIIYP